MWERIFLPCLVFFAAAGNVSPQTLKLNSNDAYPRSALDKSGFVDKILQEALGRIGSDFERILVPSARALLLADSGEIDGDYVRISGLEQSYPNLVMVSEPISVMDFVAYYPIGSGPFDTWDSLRNASIAHISGWKILEERTRDYPDVSRARDAESLFEMLKLGRVQAELYERIDGQQALRRLGLASAVQEGRVLEHRDMYLYLNKRHSRLAERLSDSLAKLRVEKRIEAIMESVLAKAE